MRGLICRSLRLELVAGLGMALALPALAAGTPRSVATETTLSAETHDQGGRTQATLTVAVTGEDGQPAAGTVAINDHGKPVGGVALNSEGQAKTVLSLPSGSHELTASYSGDSGHRNSVSAAATVNAQTSGIPSYTVSINPAALSLKAGQAGTSVATITAENTASLTAPMFITLSCSALPDQATCTFTPENVEIVPVAATTANPNSTVTVTSSLTLQTQGASTTQGRVTTPVSPAHQPHSSAVTWAFLLPGALALVGIAWGGRNRRWLNRLSLIGLIGLVTMLGTTGCNPRYNYLNHGPTANPATPSGNYTISVIAQTSNGITASSQSTTLALTVQ